MRAFQVAWRAIAGFYSELFLFVGLSLLWWLTGGFTVAIAAMLALAMLEVGGPWWALPLLAIPAGPPTAALAHVAERVAHERRADRSFYWEGWRLWWRKALAVNTVSMVVLALLVLNTLFYLNRSGLLLTFSIFWAYLVLFWLAVQLYMFPALLALREPSLFNTFRTAIILVFANPLFSLLLVILAGLLTGISIAVAILIFLAWPAVMVLLGQYSLMLLVQRAGGTNPRDGEEA